ncbi:MAG: phosphoribosylformylglycinamidine synthase subunit PurL [Pseudomonadota bacterium]
MELKEKLEFYRINTAEYERIKELLGREPQGVEWSVFSALWSEHCSYKSSKVHLKKLFNQSDRVLQSFGENAGIVDLGDGEKVAFKMESHNHPSFIEPYQGAATGVGGILRDIFTMGARPIALANYLCFGDAKADRMSDLVDGVVRGIGGYGNCVGVPTITGQTNFHDSYNENILVNAMAVGLFQEGDPICLSQAKGVGNLVVYVGAKTGRDGVHGASMASESFDEDSESKRPTVQIGDPFFEKLLIESCLEVMKKDLVVAIQDMGAAGLTSSSFEMADKGDVGLDLDLSKVPLRDETMTPEDVLLSESQERMLLICTPDQLAPLQEVFHRWGLDAVAIGDVISEPVVRLSWKGEVLTEMSPKMVVDNAPQYQRDFSPWNFDPQQQINSTTWSEKAPSELIEILDYYGASAKDWIYRQYDQRVGSSTCFDCSSPVGAVALPSGRGLGVVLGCRPSIMRQDAFLGGMDSICYPAIELASKGFQALATTDCLNFGNPEKNEVMSEFVGSLDGMNQACEAFVTPIISGNVSFYNETLEKGISPTPSTGLVGLRDNLTHLPGSDFVDEGDEILLLTLGKGFSNASFAEFQTQESHFSWDNDLSELARKTNLLKDLVMSHPVKSSRIVGNYGLAMTLAKMTLSGRGAIVDCEQSPFLEPFYQVVMTVAPEDAKNVLADAESQGLTVESIGSVAGKKLKWKTIDLGLEQVKESYENAWSKGFPRLS